MPRQKALVWILRPGPVNDPEVLLLERPARRGGGLHPVTGKAEDGEAIDASAAREAEEETGLRGELRPLDLRYDFTGRKGGAFEEYAYVLAVPQGSEPRLSDEHVAWRWVPPPEASKLVRFPAHREALDRALVEYTKLKGR